MDVNQEEWMDWRWQQRNVVNTLEQINTYFDCINRGSLERTFFPSQNRIKFQITPYMLSQIPRSINYETLQKNPWFLQFFPQGEIYSEGHGAYNGMDNWEKGAEFPTEKFAKIASRTEK